VTTHAKQAFYKITSAEQAFYKITNAEQASYKTNAKPPFDNIGRRFADR